MKLLDEILHYNEQFVSTHQFEKFTSSKFPDKKIIVLSCMDTRLTELLPHAMNLKNGDAKFIKNAGAVVTHPFGSVMRSILVAIYELGAEEVCVVGHHGCGMESIDPTKTLELMVDRGISAQTIRELEDSGIDLRSWLLGFDHIEESVRGSVEIIKKHPLMLSDIPVHGLVVDPHTGKLDLIVKGY